MRESADARKEEPDNMIRDLDTWNERLDLLHETWKFYDTLSKTASDESLAHRALAAALYTNRQYAAIAMRSPGPTGLSGDGQHR